MRKGLMVLFGVLALALGALLLTRALVRENPSDWLCRHYGLSPGQASRLGSLQEEYSSRCGPYCASMCNANARLESAAMGCSGVTPELRSLIVETDRIRTETRIAMLEHFYAVAAELPPDRRREYLLKVLPLVIDSCGARR